MNVCVSSCLCLNFALSFFEGLQIRKRIKLWLPILLILLFFLILKKSSRQMAAKTRQTLSMNTICSSLVFMSLFLTSFLAFYDKTLKFLSCNQKTAKQKWDRKAPQKESFISLFFEDMQIDKSLAETNKENFLAKALGASCCCFCWCC